MNTITLNEQIKKLRMSKKMTLAVMAERTGVTISTISAYENGTRTPSLDALIKIAKLFNVTVDNLLGFGNKDFIDVTNLTIDQRNSIEEMVILYQKFNSLVITAFKLEDADDSGISYLFSNSMESFENELKKIK